MTKLIVECLCCAKPFEKQPAEARKHPRHFCSRSCAAKVNNQGKRRHPPRSCNKCKKEYITSKTHRSLSVCEECKNKCFTTEKAKAATLGEYKNRVSVKGKHPSWVSAHVRGFNRNWNVSLTKLGCQYCGYNTHVELAHIKAISEFDDTATLAEINAPENIFVLCPNHHWELDNGKLDIANIPARLVTPTRFELV